MTRGILADLNNEAELASVIGHEIGHVTARHSVNQASKAQLAQLGLAVGVLVKPELERYAGVAQAGLSLLFLIWDRYFRCRLFRSCFFFFNDRLAIINGEANGINYFA